MKKSDAKFSKTIANIVSENSIEHLKIQSVIDHAWSHGYTKGYTRGYLAGAFIVADLFLLIKFSRSLGRDEGEAQGAKYAKFWRKLYAKTIFEKTGKKSNIAGDTEIHDDPGDTYDQMHEEGKC